MVQIVLAPCSPFSVTSDLMKQSAKLAREYGVHLHTHLAETEDEEQFCMKMFGHRPVGYMQEVDWVGERCLVRARGLGQRRRDPSLRQT